MFANAATRPTHGIAQNIELAITEVQTLVSDKRHASLWSFISIEYHYLDHHFHQVMLMLLLACYDDSCEYR